MRLKVLLTTFRDVMSYYDMGVHESTHNTEPIMHYLATRAPHRLLQYCSLSERTRSVFEASKYRENQKLMMVCVLGFEIEN